MNIISQITTLLSRSLSKNPYMNRRFDPRFVFQFIPVFWNTETKPSSAVTPTMRFKATRLKDIKTSSCGYSTPSGTFFPLKSVNYQVEAA